MMSSERLAELMYYNLLRKIVAVDFAISNEYKPRPIRLESYNEDSLLAETAEKYRSHNILREMIEYATACMLFFSGKHVPKEMQGAYSIMSHKLFSTLETYSEGLLMGLLEYEACADADLLCLAKLYSIQVGGYASGKLVDLAYLGIPDKSFAIVVLPLIKKVRASLIFDENEKANRINDFSFDELVALQERNSSDKDTKTAFKILADFFKEGGASRQMWGLLSGAIKPLVKEHSRIKKWLEDNNTSIHMWTKIVLFEELRWKKDTFANPDKVSKRIASLYVPSREMFWNDDPEDYILYSLKQQTKT